MEINYETKARAIVSRHIGNSLELGGLNALDLEMKIAAALRSVREEVLDEAAKVAYEFWCTKGNKEFHIGVEISAAIQSLKEKS